MSPLASAINNLYEAFEDVVKPEIILACPCCMTADEVETLLAKPLRDLSAEDLSSYASSALLTVGDVPDYLYFLPRILEISISGDTWYPDIEISGDKIRMTDPTSWPAPRWNALLAFFVAAVDQIIESRRYDLVDEWMCGIAAMKVEMKPFLTKIEANADAVLEYFKTNAKGLPDGKLGNAFWEEPRPGHDEIVKWFKSEPVRKILFDAYGYKV